MPVWGRPAPARTSPVPTASGEAEDVLGVFDFRDLRHRDPVTVGPFTITPVRVNHPVEAYGFRVEAGGRVLAYTGDTDMCDELDELMTGADLVLADSAFVEGRDTRARHPPLGSSRRRGGRAGRGSAAPHADPHPGLERPRGVPGGRPPRCGRVTSSSPRRTPPTASEAVAVSPAGVRPPKPGMDVTVRRAPGSRRASRRRPRRPNQGGTVAAANHRIEEGQRDRSRRHADVDRGPARRGPLDRHHPRRARRGRHPHRHRRRLPPATPTRSATTRRSSPRRWRSCGGDTSDVARRHQGRPPAPRRRLVDPERAPRAPREAARGLAQAARRRRDRALPVPPARPDGALRRVGRRARATCSTRA